MAHVLAPDYGQQFLFPPALEDWVAADHPARFLRELVDQLDLAALGFSVPTGAADGRPGYAPGLLLKVWLYGYFQRLRSTRKLEAACAEHVGLIWLTGLLRPDHNTLWRFWRDNRAALRAVFKQTVQLAVRTGCVGLALQALDGTKIEAAASGHSGWSKDRMEKLLAELDAALEQTELAVLAENAAPAPGADRLPAGLAERRALRAQIQAGLAQLAADERAHYHPVEPEARRMQTSQGNRFGYNAQAVTDSQAGIIVACDAGRSETDAGQLVPMIEQARENVGVAGAATVTVADGGYGAGAELLAAEQKGLAVLAPPREGAPAKDNPYASRHFVYDPQARTVTCPQGQTLTHQGRKTRQGVTVDRYRCRCRDCPVRAQCTREVQGRQIEVWPHTVTVQAMRQKLAPPGGRGLWRQRRELIERRFGQIKQHDGFRRWTVWGLENVRTQWALLCTTLNLRVLHARWRAGQNPTPHGPVAVALARPGAGSPRRAADGRALGPPKRARVAARATGRTKSARRSAGPPGPASFPAPLPQRF